MPKQLKWKKIGNKQLESVSLNKRYDFVIDARTKPIALLIFNNKEKNKNKSFIDSIEVISIRQGKKEAEGWGR